MAKDKLKVDEEFKSLVKTLDVRGLTAELFNQFEAKDRIIMTKKTDPHLNELREQVKDINNDYKGQIAQVMAKIELVIATLKSK